MIEFLVCPVEIIVREPLIPLEAGSQKTGLVSDFVATGFRSNLRKGPFRRRSLPRQKPPQTRLHACDPSTQRRTDQTARLRTRPSSNKRPSFEPIRLRQDRNRKDNRDQVRPRPSATESSRTRTST